MAVEPLEERLLLAAHPSIFEQYMVELINLARSDPAAYAQSLGITLNEGLAAGTISTAAKQPLAINVDLTDAARTHSQWMLDRNTFSHTGAGGSNPGQRMATAGYTFSGAWSWGENIGYRGTTGYMDRVEYSRLVQEALFVDANISGRGHRLNILNDYFAEIGVGVRSGMYSNYRSVMATQDFAKSDAPAILTGVVYDDATLRDRFYTPGEGLWGVTITAIRDGGGQTYTTSTWASGGYRLELPKGRYSIMVSGSELGPSQFMPVVLMGTRNRKFDFIKGAIRQAPEIAIYGSDRSIVNRDSTPDSRDATDFGSAAVGTGSVTNSFEIRNLGNSALLLNGTPRVTISGAHASDFEIVALPAASIAGGQSSQLIIRFSPSGSGVRTAVVRIANNDSLENPFTFTISGTGENAAFQSFWSPSFESAPSTESQQVSALATSLPEVSLITPQQIIDNTESIESPRLRFDPGLYRDAWVSAHESPSDSDLQLIALRLQ